MVIVGCWWFSGFHLLNISKVRYLTTIKWICGMHAWIVCFPMQGSPFPSGVVEVLMLQTSYIPSSCMYNLGCFLSESRH